MRSFHFGASAIFALVMLLLAGIGLTMLCNDGTYLAAALVIAAIVIMAN